MYQASISNTKHYLVDRYVERVESAKYLSQRVNQMKISSIDVSIVA